MTTDFAALRAAIYTSWVALLGDKFHPYSLGVGPDSIARAIPSGISDVEELVALLMGAAVRERDGSSWQARWLELTHGLLPLLPPAEAAIRREQVLALAEQVRDRSSKALLLQRVQPEVLETWTFSLEVVTEHGRLPGIQTYWNIARGLVAHGNAEQLERLRELLRPQRELLAQYLLVRAARVPGERDALIEEAFTLWQRHCDVWGWYVVEHRLLALGMPYAWAVYQAQLGRFLKERSSLRRFERLAGMVRSVLRLPPELLSRATFDLAPGLMLIGDDDDEPWENLEREVAGLPLMRAGRLRLERLERLAGMLRTLARKGELRREQYPHRVWTPQGWRKLLPIWADHLATTMTADELALLASLARLINSPLARYTYRLSLATAPRATDELRGALFAAAFEDARRRLHDREEYGQMLGTLLRATAAVPGETLSGGD